MGKKNIEMIANFLDGMELKLEVTEGALNW
jgi:hypothetical protein